MLPFTPLWSPQGDNSGVQENSPFEGGRGMSNAAEDAGTFATKYKAEEPNRNNQSSTSNPPPTPSLVEGPYPQGGLLAFASLHAAVPYFGTIPKTEKYKLVSFAVNHLVADDELCKSFMLNEKILSSLAPIIKSHENINELAADIIYLQHVGAALRKLKNPNRSVKESAQKVKDLIHRSIESEDVVDVFQMAGIERFDISIINDDFLATAKAQKTGNELKLELIRQILNDEIKVRSAKNLAKSRKLKEAVEKILADYHNHFFDSLVAMEKLREVAKDMQEEDQRRNQLGLTEEEEAFYEILANHPNAVQDFDLIKELVQKILAEVKKSASQPDWYKKDDTKAQLQLAVKKVLRFKVKAELQEILDEIMEQAEARYKEYKMGVA
ncbi:DUF3387 domain-containing protein [Pontibacter sp. E15-1]|uniref:DUF3387 domain-containing protein n=1 Tax=Pontibacter sp. E15-1 TaxID=2919918 RepID=UPI00397D8522